MGSHTSYKRTAKPARPGYALVIDHEATEKFGRRLLKWVPITTVATTSTTTVKEGV